MFFDVFFGENLSYVFPICIYYHKINRMSICTKKLWRNATNDYVSCSTVRYMRTIELVIRSCNHVLQSLNIDLQSFVQAVVSSVGFTSCADIPSCSDRILPHIRATALTLPLASSFTLCETFILLSLADSKKISGVGALSERPCHSVQYHQINCREGALALPRVTM